MTKSTTKGFKKQLMKFKLTCQQTAKNSYICQMLFDYKFYVLLILIALSLLFILPAKIWALVFLGIISYVTAIMDDATRLAYPVQTGPAFCLVLAALGIHFWFLVAFFLATIILPHLQMQKIFEPFNLMTYLGLAIVLKVIRILPTDVFLSTIIGLIIFHIWVFIIQHLKGSVGKTAWAILKNAVLVVMLFLSPLYGILTA